MSKHTKGPWDYISDTRDVIVSRAGFNDVLIAQLYKIGQDHEANARLIAAAPEMLELLKKCQSMLIGQEFKTRDSRVVDSIDELLIKLGEKK